MYPRRYARGTSFILNIVSEQQALYTSKVYTIYTIYTISQ